ncbi:hypothetical protein [Nocardia pseudobrasiliensis]|uniref:Uncharacterized protein n=1 Tax=Nocardia pseudobrasiliensis TaxID=45979 RepID=A0A370I0C6_9NOCA|nr:hypothetical protein [Nocardia pseudobrasiliensis]RDI64207.1 hypothetical protein DFR76_10838 [Nocardia pseudobrasiliensis]
MSSYATPHFVAKVREAGVEIIEKRESTFRPDHPNALPEPHLFVYARRPQAN